MVYYYSNDNSMVYTMSLKLLYVIGVKLTNDTVQTWTI